EPQVALRRDHLDPAQSRGGHTQRAGVKIVGVQNRYALLYHRLAEPQNLFNRVCIEEAVQWEFRHVRVTLDDLPAQRPAPAQNSQPRVETLFVEPIEQLNRLAFGTARVETVDQVEHSWATVGCHTVDVVRESEHR